MGLLSVLELDDETSWQCRHEIGYRGGQLVLPDLCFCSSRIQLKRNALLVLDLAPVARM